MENQLVTILRIKTPQLGSFVKDKFASEGIECFFTNEDLSLGSVYNPDEVLINVKASQSEKAIKLLLQIHKEYDLEKISLNKELTELKKILFPVLLGDDCISLCKYAIRLAEKINAEIKLVYVYEDPNLNEPNRPSLSWEKHVKLELNDARNKALLKLVRFSDELKKQIPEKTFKKVKLHYRMLKGDPSTVIVDAAKRYNPDFVIMGTTKKANENGEFVSKMLSKIIQQSDFPILTIPAPFSPILKKSLNVLYATNFYEKDNSSLNNLMKILHPLKKKIHCVHIEMYDDPLFRQKVDELNKMLELEYSGHHIKCELFESKNVLKGISDFAEQNDIDIISFSKLKRSAIYKMFHSSLLEKLISENKVPVLIFPV